MKGDGLSLLKINSLSFDKGMWFRKSKKPTESPLALIY